jgi:hypothetical protein
MKKFDRVSIESSAEYHTAEHEVFLSFCDDDGAVAFQEWLTLHGWEAFAKWLKKNGHGDLL